MIGGERQQKKNEKFINYLHQSRVAPTFRRFLSDQPKISQGTCHSMQ